MLGQSTRYSRDMYVGGDMILVVVYSLVAVVSIVGIIVYKLKALRVKEAAKVHPVVTASATASHEELQRQVEAATEELHKANEELMHLNATKDEFVSMASHQLRTPLTSIKGYLSMVLEGDAGELNDDQRKLLTEAFTSSERMVRLIGDFLNVSRLQNGKFMIDRAQCDLAEVVAQEINNVKEIAASRGIGIAYHKPSKFPLLYLDEDKMRQVIMNYLDNAIYYSPDSKVISVRLYTSEGNVVLEVIDKGMGVQKKVQKKLFSKFFRAENAQRQRPDGTGIGLYLAKMVVDGHWGKIVFASEEGKGSTFGFRLPVKKLSTPPPPVQ